MFALTVFYYGLLTYAVATLDDVIVAIVAAVASIVNTYMLVRARHTQKMVKKDTEEVKRQLDRLKTPIGELRDLADQRQRQIGELESLNRNLSHRIIELREVEECLGTRLPGGRRIFDPPTEVE